MTNTLTKNTNIMSLTNDELRRIALKNGVSEDSANRMRTTDLRNFLRARMKNLRTNQQSQKQSHRIRSKLHPSRSSNKFKQQIMTKSDNNTPVIHIKVNQLIMAHQQHNNSQCIHTTNSAPEKPTEVLEPSVQRTEKQEQDDMKKTTETTENRFRVQKFQKRPTVTQNNACLTRVQKKIQHNSTFVQKVKQIIHTYNGIVQRLNDIEEQDQIKTDILNEDGIDDDDRLYIFQVHSKFNNNRKNCLRELQELENNIKLLIRSKDAVLHKIKRDVLYTNLDVQINQKIKNLQTILQIVQQKLSYLKKNNIHIRNAFVKTTQSKND